MGRALWNGLAQADVDLEVLVVDGNRRSESARAVGVLWLMAWLLD